MIRVSLPIIVEGKYDKITLENIVDATIIPTNGFMIFKDSQKCGMIRELAKLKGGIIILTDSDSAGSLIRGYIKNIVGDVSVINVYVPALKGKEKRKAKQSKEGFLGVEGMSEEIILSAFKKSGIKDLKIDIKKEKITKTDLFEFSLSGTDNSSLNRKRLLKNLGLPTNLSANAMLDILNAMYDKNEFKKVAIKCLKEDSKN